MLGAKKFIQLNHTAAFARFEILIERTSKLIEAGNFGIDELLKKEKPFLEQFKNISTPKGRPPKKYKQKIIKHGTNLDGSLTLEVDVRTAYWMKKIFLELHQNEAELRYHLNSIMVVYLWASFETYLLMLFQGLFIKKPEMLKTSDTISYKEIIENKSRLVDHLIERELERIGHFNLNEHLKYLTNKINIIFPDLIRERLIKIYLIRNIIAHNTGIIPGRLHAKIPKNIKIRNNELLVSPQFLKSESTFIVRVVNSIERQVDKKFDK